MNLRYKNLRNTESFFKIIIYNVVKVFFYLDSPEREWENIKDSPEREWENKLCK